MISAFCVTFAKFNNTDARKGRGGDCRKNGIWLTKPLLSTAANNWDVFSCYFILKGSAGGPRLLGALKPFADRRY